MTMCLSATSRTQASETAVCFTGTRSAQLDNRRCEQGELTMPAEACRAAATQQSAVGVDMCAAPSITLG